MHLDHTRERGVPGWDAFLWPWQRPRVGLIVQSSPMAPRLTSRQAWMGMHPQRRGRRQLPLRCSFQCGRDRAARPPRRAQERRGSQGRVGPGHLRIGQLLPAWLGNSQGCSRREAGMFAAPVAIESRTSDQSPPWSVGGSTRLLRDDHRTDIGPLSTTKQQRIWATLVRHSFT